MSASFKTSCLLPLALLALASGCAAPADGDEDLEESGAAASTGSAPTKFDFDAAISSAAYGDTHEFSDLDKPTAPVFLKTVKPVYFDATSGLTSRRYQRNNGGVHCEFARSTSGKEGIAAGVVLVLVSAESRAGTAEYPHNTYPDSIERGAWWAAKVTFDLRRPGEPNHASGPTLTCAWDRPGGKPASHARLTWNDVQSALLGVVDVEKNQAAKYR